MSTAAKDRKEEVIAEIRQLLDMIGDPCAVAQGIPMGIEEMGLVREVTIDDEGHVEIDLRLSSPSCMMVGYFRVEAERLVLALPEVASVSVKADLGIDWKPEMMRPQARRRRREALRARGMPGALVAASVPASPPQAGG